MKVAILGALGQLGHDLLAELPGDLLPWDLPEVDVCQEDTVRDACEQQRPDLVINCAALTNVDGCEEDRHAAYAINAEGAGVVARSARRVGAGVIYISTDFVFGGQADRTTPYMESDPPAPLSVYGASKLAGENETIENCPHATVVRTCGLYGHAGALGKGGNFVETMLRLAAGDKPIRVVSDQVLTPTSSRALARVLAELVLRPAEGILHVAAADACSWHTFASAIIASVDPQRVVQPIPTSDYPLPAQRPAYSVLGSERLAGLGITSCPSWREMLNEYLATRPRRD